MHRSNLVKTERGAILDSFPVNLSGFRFDQTVKKDLSGLLGCKTTSIGSLVNCGSNKNFYDTQIPLTWKSVGLMANARLKSWIPLACFNFIFVSPRW